MQPHYTAAQIMRFWARVSRAPHPTGCWLWTGTHDDGYGRLTVGSRAAGSLLNEFAHRMSYRLHYGVIYPGLCVCHSCDNPACVNPDHLWLGNQAQNTLDMIHKGRNVRGQRVHTAHLNESEVRAIRTAYRAGKTSYWKLAKQYGVTAACIGYVVRRQSWNWLV